MSRTGRWTGAAAAALLVVAPTLATAAPASASTSAPGYCTDSVGVTVVVDFQGLGGGVVVRCLTHPSSSTTGLDALLGTGFSVTGVARYGNDSFVCRIDGQPTAANEACIDTPPASYYWSYWSASNGGRWAYSSAGPMSHRAIHGGFEGWSFSDRKTATTSPPPRVAPVHAVAVPTTTPAPTRAPTPPPPGPSSTGTAPGSTSRSPTATPVGSLAAHNPTQPTPAASASAGGVLAGGSSGPPISFVASAPQVAGGSAWSSVVGVVLVLAALCGATTVAVRRRRARLADGG